MELSFDGRQELRKATEKLLESVPEGKRIQLPKKTLEMLLFEKGTYEEDLVAIYPFWSGDFLKKLDLSQISFKDICFQADEMYGAFEDIFKHDNFGQIIKYRDTNAEINFDEFTDYRYVNGCDFSGTKITGKISSANDCNFSNCQLTADSLKECRCSYNCNFMHNNLKGLNIDYNYVLGDGEELANESYCSPSNFSYTGVSFSKESFKKMFNVVREYINNNSIVHDKEKYIKECCDEIMSNLEGCYVDGVLIKSEEEIQKTASEKKEEYEKMKQDILDSIENAVIEQGSKPRK